VLLYASGTSLSNNQIVWFDRAGKLLGTVGAPGPVMEPSLSPDEKIVAYQRKAGDNADLWLRDLERGTETRLTFAASNRDPVWSPRGDRIVFNSLRVDGKSSNQRKLYQKAANGSGNDEFLLEGVAVATLSVARTQAVQNRGFCWSRSGMRKTVFGACRRFLGERLFAIISGPPRPLNDHAIVRGRGRIRRHSGVVHVGPR